LFIDEAGDEIVDDTKLCFGDQELKESRVLIWKGRKDGWRDVKGEGTCLQVGEYRDFQFGYLSSPRKNRTIQPHSLVVISWSCEKFPFHGSSSSVSPLNCGNWCSGMLIPPPSSPEPSEAFPQTERTSMFKIYNRSRKRTEKVSAPACGLLCVHPL
jgi:hypothetical protein